MATKIEKKNREPKPKFFDEEILKEVADVADAERKDYDQPQPVKTDIVQQQASKQSERVGAGRPKIERKVKREVLSRHRDERHTLCTDKRILQKIRCRRKTLLRRVGLYTKTFK